MLCRIRKVSFGLRAKRTHSWARSIMAQTCEPDERVGSKLRSQRTYEEILLSDCQRLLHCNHGKAFPQPKHTISPPSSGPCRFSLHATQPNPLSCLITTLAPDEGPYACIDQEFSHINVGAEKVLACVSSCSTFFFSMGCIDESSLSRGLDEGCRLSLIHI